MDVAKLQQVINIFGAQWTATDTDVSRANVAPGTTAYMGLSFTEQERMQQIQFAQQTETFQPTVTLPSAVDWRSNGGDYVTSVKNQKSCGSCVAFATCATLEARARIKYRDPNLDIDLSESHIFSCGCGNCCATGWQGNLALDFAARTGVGAEDDFPYQPGDQACRPINPILRVTSYSALQSLAARKQGISLRGPVSGSIAVYEDFMHYGQGIYKHVAGSLVGYHQICVVGYDDSQSCWIVKNSWGHWGENGFFRIAYGECGIDTQFPFYDPAVTLLAGA